MLLQGNTLADIICDNPYGVSIGMQTVETGTEGTHGHRTVITILMSHAVKYEVVDTGIAHLINIITEVAEHSRNVGIAGIGRAELATDDWSASRMSVA